MVEKIKYEEKKDTEKKDTEKKDTEKKDAEKKDAEKKEKESAINSSKKERDKLKENLPPVSRKEGNVYYYKVKEGQDTTTIAKDLARYSQFNYLDPKKYGARGNTGRNEVGFNITKDALKPGMEIMIPLPLETRQFEDKEFFEVCQKAIDNIQSNPVYGKRILDLVKNIGKTDLARVMSAFAKVETAGGLAGVKIGTGGLYRYESTNRYSVSYFHVLVEGAGAKALNNLNMTPGEACDPINAGMLFLGYWCEIESALARKGFKLENYLNPKNPNRFKNAAKIYNGGSRSYPSALQKSYNGLKI